MDVLRGVLMVAVGAFALYRGVLTHAGKNSWMAIGLGLVAMALGVWRLTRKAPAARLNR
jgi:hypothetical protein